MAIPPELQSDLDLFSDRWELPSLQAWLEILPEQVAQGMSEKRYGDLPAGETR